MFTKFLIFFTFCLEIWAILRNNFSRWMKLWFLSNIRLISIKPRTRYNFQFSHHFRRNIREYKMCPYKLTNSYRRFSSRFEIIDVNIRYNNYVAVTQQAMSNVSTTCWLFTFTRFTRLFQRKGANRSCNPLENEKTSKRLISNFLALLIKAHKVMSAHQKNVIDFTLYLSHQKRDCMENL